MESYNVTFTLGPDRDGNFDAYGYLESDPDQIEVKIGKFKEGQTTTLCGNELIFPEEC